MLGLYCLHSGPIFDRCSSAVPPLLFSSFAVSIASLSRFSSEFQETLLSKIVTTFFVMREYVIPYFLTKKKCRFCGEGTG